MDFTQIANRIEGNATRVAILGGWPDRMVSGAREIFMQRVPTVGKPAPGFDAGMACVLDIIPRNKQRLAARLHAAYSFSSVQQIVSESGSILDSEDPPQAARAADSETAWWLAMSYLCHEDGGGVSTERFLEQVDEAEKLAISPDSRAWAAICMYRRMTGSFSLEQVGDLMVPIGTADGCIQGAYVAGHQWGVHRSAGYGCYFFGTVLESLGLEGFEWSDKTDAEGRPLSGPVGGSKQFVKCADFAELERAVRAADEYWCRRLKEDDLEWVPTNSW